MAALRAAIAAVLAATTLAGCVPSASGGAAEGPAAGYGVGPVEGETLPDMLAHCATGGFTTPECLQLRRTQHSQPGNAAP